MRLVITYIFDTPIDVDVEKVKTAAETAEDAVIEAVWTELDGGPGDIFFEKVEEA